MNPTGPVLRITYLYPDLMNLYADRGNVTCLEQRCAWRGLTPLIHRLEWNDRLAGTSDLYVIGGGQDRQQQLASKGLTTRECRSESCPISVTAQRCWRFAGAIN